MREYPKLTEVGMGPVNILLQEYLNDIAFKDADHTSSSEEGYADLLEGKYDPMSPQAIVDSCTHLLQEQRNDLVKFCFPSSKHCSMENFASSRMTCSRRNSCVLKVLG